METTIRHASQHDVEGILTLVNGYAAENLMLPRTPAQVEAALPMSLVAVYDSKIVGCGSLVALTPRLVELRSLAVANGYRGTGLGRVLVEALIDWARKLGYEEICALTMNEGFFNRMGFPTVDRWTISPKIWQECVFCPKFDACDETAVLLNLRETAAQADGVVGEQWSARLAPIRLFS